MFKGLLFLGAGAVVQSTRTRNMEEMGGLIRRMPATALFFLIGAIAISGLPPLNGFVSEWLTYQALLAGFGTHPEPHPPDVPDRRRAAGADRRAGRGVLREGVRHPVPGAAAQRDGRRTRTEAALAMRIGMGVLAAACVVLGLGATWVLPVFDPITEQALGVPRQRHRWWRDGIALQAGSRARRHGLHRRDRACCSWRWRDVPAYSGRLAAAQRARRHRTHLGLRPARPDRRQRIHRDRVFQAAAHDLRRLLPAAARDPGRSTTSRPTIRARSASKARSSPRSRSTSTVR